VDLDRAATGVLFATGNQPGLAGTTVTMPAESAAVLTTA
jgi:maltooligosyltrehalose trehalohydrolase